MKALRLTLLLLAYLAASASARLLSEPASDPAPAPASSAKPLIHSSELCDFLAPDALGVRSLILSADPGTMTGIPETRWILKNANLSAEGRTAYCPQIAVGTVMAQPVAIATTGINAVSAALCTEQLLSCASAFKEILWLGTSGWSPQIGGLLDGDDCSKANQSPEVTRVGDVCISPLGLALCYKGDWSGNANGAPNVCSNPQVIIGPEMDSLFGNCMFTDLTAADQALADEMIAAARSSAYGSYPPRNTLLAQVETTYWKTMSNGTGVAYDYTSGAPKIYDYTQCAEVTSPMFWSGSPWDSQAREFVAQLITASGAANVTRKDVIAVSAMEASGLLDALSKYEAAEGWDLPVVIVRGNSNYDTNTVKQVSPGVWIPGPVVEPDLSAGYDFAIKSTSAALLSLLRSRCAAAGGPASVCTYRTS